MFKHLVKCLGASLLVFYAALAHASEVHVLRMAPAGAGGALWSEAVFETLQRNGYTPKLVAANSCREAATWLKANPGKPVVYATFSDYAIMDMIDPSHPAACGLSTDETSLVTIVGRWWNFVCGHKDRAPSIEALRNQPDAKAGVWNYPISMNVAKAHLTSVGYSGKVVGFASGKQLMLAFTSGDLDYIILSSENLARSLVGAQCFATSAAPEQAKIHMPERTSYSQHSKEPVYVGYGLWPYVAAINTDVAKLRTVFQKNPGPLYLKLQENLVPETASVETQLRDLHKVAQQIAPIVRGQ